MKKQPSNWIEGMAMELKSKRYKYNMKDPLQELLTITMEECGELIQACSKAIRCEEYYNNEKLIEEIGDVQCMIDLIRQYDLVSLEEINNRIDIKEKKLKF